MLKRKRRRSGTANPLSRRKNGGMDPWCGQREGCGSLGRAESLEGAGLAREGFGGVGLEGIGLGGMVVWEGMVVWRIVV